MKSKKHLSIFFLVILVFQACNNNQKQEALPPPSLPVVEVVKKDMVKAVRGN